MNIIFNTLTLGLGGAERVIANLCKCLIKSNNQLTIVSAIHGRTRYELPAGVEVHYLDNTLADAKENKISRFIRRREKLSKVLVQLKPDIVLSFLPEPNFLILSIRNKIQAPIIISIRSDPHVLFRNIFYKSLMRIFYPLADGYVFQTQAARNYFAFSNQIYERGTVIPNPVNMEFAKAPFAGKRRLEIVSVGRLDPEKNQINLITAFSMLKTKYSDYILIIYGEGAMRKSLELEIDRLNLTNRAFLAGEKSNIKDLIYESSLFVLSSNNEGMPNALIEAMCLGLPVVSTDCPIGGPAALINDGINGLLCEVNNSEDLTEKMESILRDPDKGMDLSNEAVKLSQRLNPERIGRLWEEYICKLFDGNL